MAASSSSSSSSSSSKPRRSYDVFLSFRGPDVRNYFLGHLYTALDGMGISTYRDDEELRKGERISAELMKAIRESRIAIIVFSVNYASSTWCLEELAEIMERKEQRDLMVFPVFYKVDPREVRTPRESYLEAMTKHERKFGRDSERVTSWKRALSEAGSLSGWHFTVKNHLHSVVLGLPSARAFLILILLPGAIPVRYTYYQALQEKCLFRASAAACWLSMGMSHRDDRALQDIPLILVCWRPYRSPVHAPLLMQHREAPVYPHLSM